jgi:hypothetical protein
MAGDMDEAIALGVAAVEELSALDHHTSLATALTGLCGRLVMINDLVAARARAVEALPLLEENEQIVQLADPLALLTTRAGDHKSAAMMLGYAQAWRFANQSSRGRNAARIAELASGAIDTALGAAEHARHRDAGAAMTTAQATEQARALLRTGDDGRR